MARRGFVLCLVVSLLVNAFSLPAEVHRRTRQVTNEDDSKDKESSTSSTTSIVIGDAKSDDDDDDDDFDQPSTSGGGGGSSILSLLNLVTAMFPSSSSGSSGINHKIIQAQMAKKIKEIINKKHMRTSRADIADNLIEIDINGTAEVKPFERQESEEEDHHSSSSESGSASDENSGGEESAEEAGETDAKQDSASNASNGSDDYDEPSGGDGQGGILGILAGLSGDGESDLGSLLAAVGGIVANLSGDGVDINGIISTALGLLVGLLSDENQNPGEIIAEYIVTALDSISGGGAKNNGAFFGNFLSKIVKGISAGESTENSMEIKMSDSAGFFTSLLMGLLGEMSKSSSGGSSR